MSGLAINISGKWESKLAVGVMPPTRPMRSTGFNRFTYLEMFHHLKRHLEPSHTSCTGNQDGLHLGRCEECPGVAKVSLVLSMNSARVFPRRGRKGFSFFSIWWRVTRTHYRRTARS